MRSRSGKIIARMPDGVLQFEQAYYPFADEIASDVLPEALDERTWTAIPRPPAHWLAHAEGRRLLSEEARKLRKMTDRAIIGMFGGSLLEMGGILFRQDNFLMLLGSAPHKAHDFLDQIVEIHLAKLDNFLEAVGKYIDVIFFR